MSEDVDATTTSIKDLRSELKAWEKAFAAGNGGRKAGREDIKRDAHISAKYKEYERLAKKTKEVSTPRKRARIESGNQADEVLKERRSNIVSRTPKREKDHSNILQPVDNTEIAEEGPTPAIVRCALGPTPQKDGAILGIFDMLPSGTPSKSVELSMKLSGVAVGATPSKTAATSSSEPKLSKTPQSSATRNFLESFVMTPLKRKRDDSNHTPSTTRRQYATPAFLRRNLPLAKIDEESNDAAIAAPPFKKRGLVRSLSTIIQGLRRHEEERMDEEWDVMNDMEAEERGESRNQKASKVLVEDSQVADMPLGPDRGVESDEETGDNDPGALDANGQPRKVWKKKGLKRQTRRVIMRPVSQKAKKSTKPVSSDYDSEPEADGAQRKSLQSPSHSVGGGKSDEETDGSDYKHDSPQHAASSPHRKDKRKQKAAKTGTDQKTTTEDAATTKKAKKIKPDAHANFRKLKIKNKNSKAKGRGGRFARR